MNGERPPGWYLNYYFMALVLVWTLGMAVMLLLHGHEEEKEIIHGARIEARALFRRDLAYMRWNVRQGGVYVAPESGPQAGRHPASVPAAKLELADGRILTLVDPATMTRQAYRGEDLQEGYSGRLVDLGPRPLREVRDGRRTAAVEGLAAAAEEFSAIRSDNGRDVLRLVRALPAEKTCDPCHQPGTALPPVPDSAMSLSIPLSPMREAGSGHRQAVMLRYALLWLVGTTALVAGFLRLRRQIAATMRHNSRLIEAEESVNFLTYYDKLTGLPNHQLFADRLKLALVHADRLQQQIAVAELSLDNVQRVNDSCGHATGDDLVRDIAGRLTDCLRPDDSVGRIGQDRFLLLLPGLRRAEDAAGVLEKIRHRLEQVFEIGGREFYLCASAGIALFPNDGRDAETLVRHAGIALNQVRDLRCGDFHFYSPAMNTRAMEQLAMDAGLRRAVGLGQMEVYYQPQVDLGTGRIQGSEALLRWNHPELGSIAPATFIPLAEDSGMILSLGRWVLSTACAQVATWRRATGRDLQIAVNLSPLQLQQADLVETIEEVLAETGLPPQALELEITENALIANFDRALEILTDLKIRGVRIAVDDFGTGYSSLAYLVKFPIDRLKVDRSLVAELEKNQSTRVVIRSIVDMAKRMHIDLIAEGVETAAQKELLLGKNCFCMQGYFFGRPMPAGDFAVLLDTP